MFDNGRQRHYFIVARTKTSGRNQIIQSSKGSYKDLNVVLDNIGSRRMSMGKLHELLQNTNTYLEAKKLQRTVGKKNRLTLERNLHPRFTDAGDVGFAPMTKFYVGSASTENNFVSAF